MRRRMTALRKVILMVSVGASSVIIAFKIDVRTKHQKFNSTNSAVASFKRMNSYSRTLVSLPHGPSLGEEAAEVLPVK